MKRIKRIVDTGFWSDEKVLDFSPEDKYFMLFLLTNEYTTQLGVYYLPIKKAAFDLGYSEDTVRVLLDRFENKYSMLKYSVATGEVALKNYLVYSVVSGGKPLYDCLVKEADIVKDIGLLDYVYTNLLTKDVKNDTVSKFIIHLNNILNTKGLNNNDNDNERIVDESSTNRGTNRQRIVDESLPVPKKPEKQPIVYFPQDEKLNEAFNEFLSHRKEIKKPMTDRAIKLAIGSLNKLSGGDNDKAIEIINQSIMNGWQGLFELKTESNNRVSGYINAIQHRNDHVFAFGQEEE